ncbi:YbaB/EbfC family nucleoid-associated protein [Spirilliplanes yamanashiensis]|uniref:YbaB/EbfC DNA-binding family protein n=1 Tax=Spirilliplanes yamanashiensis TaxID=42233 RepID=A0A8J4DKV3_9ACTN|nr:YbaB/EbfC family nucleoid-associated protein [Spirilliplanes yamanashiensis]MDP9816187.1 hypothetical protein [Spirilliplanes yamanashiensis]GIJ05712.1 hypothetical protein Sya03_50640 [Spirilliplanes yamanashiensis]
MLGPDLDDAEDRLRAWSARPSGRADAAAALADRVAGISATATGAGDAIRVTVGSSGALTDLQLADRVQRMTGAELAGEIVRTMRRAQANLTTQVAAAVDDTVGGESETGRAVLDSFAQRFPEPAADPAEPVMPAPKPFPSFGEQGSFPSRPSFPHQADRR